MLPLLLLLAICPLPAARGEDTHAALLAARQSITAEQLGGLVDYLAQDAFEGREAGSHGGRAVGDYLLGEMKRLGLEPAGENGTYVQDFGAGYRNLLGLSPGSDPKLKDQVVIVGAHYDHVGYGTRYNSFGPIGQIHNGADDNASGTSGVLALARSLALLSPRPKRSVLFVFWDAEEKGLLGSKHWIAQPTLPPARVVQVVNVDMIGRLRGEHLILVGNRTRCGLRRLASELNEGGRLKIEFPWEIKANADHYPFYDHHIPAITVHTGEHEDYHRPSDKSNRINRDGMQQVGRFLLDMVYELANRPLLAGYREAARREAGSSEKTLIESTSKPPDRLGATWQTLDEATPGPVLLGIVPGAPADKAQLRRGDRVVSVAGREVRSDSELERQLQIAQGPVEIVVRRYGQAEPLKRKVELEGSPMRVGISWRVDDAEPGTIVLSYVLADSPAARAGLAAGDRIYQVGGHNFRDEQEFAKLLEGGPRPLDLLVERDGRLRHAIIQWTADALRRAA